MLLTQLRRVEEVISTDMDLGLLSREYLNTGMAEEIMGRK
jgi:hypothetical protein